MATHLGKFRLGLIGAGSFGRFCLDQFRDLPAVEPAAIADANVAAARDAAEASGVDACETVDDLLRREDIDVVHIATPPSTHRSLAIDALEAGKHVLCEKPLATRLDDAEAMIDAAARAKRFLAVNLIMRYNPLTEAVEKIMSERLLGEPLHGFFENYAKDQPLGPQHWFWDPAISGGIFIEHGVHFFDLFRWWLGEGEVVAAQSGTRPGAEITEQVNCTVRYDNGAIVNFYHGFHQATVMDRQEFRIVCERGDIRLFEWVPTALEINTLADERTIERLQAIVPNAETVETLAFDEHSRSITSRHKDYDAAGRYTVRGDVGMDKPALYGHVVRSLLADQLAAVDDPSHQRRVTEANGLQSLRLAVKAQALTGAG